MFRFSTAAAALAVSLALPGARAGAASPAPLLPSAATIHIRNFMFVPMSTTIHAGDRVTFVNDDDEAHTATASDRSFDSEGLDAHATWQHVFTRAGTIGYFCELHPYMKATIVVLPATAGART
jgi:plastocyanin